MAIAIALLGWDDNRLRGKVEDIIADKAKVEAVLQVEKDNLEICSTKTKDLEAAQAKKETEVRKAQEAAAVAAKTYERKAQALLGAKPSTPGDACKSASDLAKNYLKSRKQ